MAVYVLLVSGVVLASEDPLEDQQTYSEETFPAGWRGRLLLQYTRLSPLRDIIAEQSFPRIYMMTVQYVSLINNLSLNLMQVFVDCQAPLGCTVFEWEFSFCSAFVGTFNAFLLHRLQLC